MNYQLSLRLKNLCRLCHLWQRQVQIIPGGNNHWGPSQEQLQEAADIEYSSSIDDHLVDRVGIGSDASSASSEDGEDPGNDGDLCEHLEAMVFTEEYRDTNVETDLAAAFLVTSANRRRPDGSPTKRTRQDLM